MCSLLLHLSKSFLSCTFQLHSKELKIIIVLQDVGLMTTWPSYLSYYSSRCQSYTVIHYLGNVQLIPLEFFK